MTQYLLALVFASVGVALGGINVWNNAMAVNGGSFAWNDLTMLVAGLAIVSALLSLSLGAIARKSKIIAALCVATVIGCTFTSVGYTLSRVGGVADHGASEALSHNSRIDLATQEVDALTRKRDAEESKGGCGRKCRDIEKRLTSARSALAALGARKVVDPAGERLEAVFGSLMPAQRYRVAHPVVTAATLELGTALLLTISGLFASSGAARRARTIKAEIVTINPVVKALEVHGTASNRELARAIGWSEAKTSRTVKRLTAEGCLTVGREGKAKTISLA